MGEPIRVFGDFLQVQWISPQPESEKPNGREGNRDFFHSWYILFCEYGDKMLFFSLIYDYVINVLRESSMLMHNTDLKEN